MKESVPENEIVSDHSFAPNAFTLIAPEAKTYLTGDTLTLALSFPSVVTVDTTLGLPFIIVILGGTSVEAVYASGDGTKILNFEYGIGGMDLDTDGIQANFLDLNGATLNFMLGQVVLNCNTTLLPVHFTNVNIN